LASKNSNFKPITKEITYKLENDTVFPPPSPEIRPVEMVDVPVFSETVLEPLTCSIAAAVDSIPIDDVVAPATELIPLEEAVSPVVDLIHREEAVASDRKMRQQIRVVINPTPVVKEVLGQHSGLDILGLFPGYSPQNQFHDQLSPISPEFQSPAFHPTPFSSPLNQYHDQLSPISLPTNTWNWPQGPYHSQSIYNPPNSMYPAAPFYGFAAIQQQPVPVVMQSTPAATLPRKPSANSNGSTCFNCRATETPLWRRSGDELCCNACGL
jgi:hypothetical protein